MYEENDVTNVFVVIMYVLITTSFIGNKCTTVYFMLVLLLTVLLVLVLKDNLDFKNKT